MSDAKWDLPKIREACLELMGWRTIPNENGYDWPIWIQPNGKRAFVDISNGHGQIVPDPTRSLDDALPLLSEYGIVLHPPGTYYKRGVLQNEDWWSAQYIREFMSFHEMIDQPLTDSPALLVCLAALLSKHKNLDEFRVKP